MKIATAEAICDDGVCNVEGAIVDGGGIAYAAAAIRCIAREGGIGEGKVTRVKDAAAAEAAVAEAAVARDCGIGDGEGRAKGVVDAAAVFGDSIA